MEETFAISEFIAIGTGQIVRKQGLADTIAPLADPKVAGRVATAAAAPPLCLFLALWPDDQVRRRIADHARRWTFPRTSKLYRPADWHVTLHFLGNVPAERVPEIDTSAVVQLNPFELVLDRPEVWRGELAVMCATAVPQPLVDLHARLGRVLRGMNITVETRPLRPHVTLARSAKGAVPPTTSAPVLWAVKAFALVVSTGGESARYGALRSYC